MAEDKKSNLKFVMEALGEEAMKNEHLTYEELQILKQVSFDLVQYEQALDLALKDEVITSTEQARLNRLKDQIQKNAITVANLDKVVDEEEQALIGRLCEVLDKYLQ